MSRLGWALVAACATSVLITARLLTPSPLGRGTHLALGLPPCGFLAWTGLPCPTCGLTTAFALLAHGQLGASLRVHPLGLPLFLLLLALLALSARALVRNESLLATVDRLHADRWALVLVLALLATWLARLVA